MKKNFLKYLSDHIVVFDGAFGTMLQRAVGDPGVLPEKLNLKRPDVVSAIHREYAEAGADVITANTFGANRAKAGELSDELIRSAVSLARSAAPDKYIALDIGPTGRLAEPAGDMTFGEAYDIFSAAVRAGKDADVILIETMSDMTELRAALLAARENSDKPVIATMTFMGDGRTFTGVDAECFALTAFPLADAVGVNCSLGPAELLPIVKKLVTLTPKPVVVQPNAGLPDAQGRYSVGAEEFAAYADEFLRLGVRVIGGCCGTTPEHIALTAAAAHGRKPVPSRYVPRAAVCSATKAVVIDGVRVIGERINPTGKKAMKAALIAGDWGYAAKQAVEQADAGADILDVNAGLPDIDERKVLTELVRRVQRVTDLPLQIDTSDPAAAESALRVYNGKAIINSVSGEEKSLEAILPLAAKYGAAVVGLTVDERGVPKTTEDRVAIAEKIISRAADFGIPEQDIYIDCLTLTVGAEQEQAMRTLEAIRIIKCRHDVRTVLGVSNVSFGLPARRIVNSAFLTAALWAGLDLPILNPNLPENMQAVAAFNVLTCRDRGCAEYSRRYAGADVSFGEARKTPDAQLPAGSNDLHALVVKGLPTAEETKRLLAEGRAPLDIINNMLIPALTEIGGAYECGKAFLPQLLASADSAKESFAAVREHMPAAAETKGVVVMATVKGDVHDIGKNIAATVLENYGYSVVDLGKNVPPADVAAAVKAHGARLCGLSALMTTTVPNMEETINLLRRECPDCRIMVGGAVLTEEYAKKIGADYYCKDALADVRIAEEVYKLRNL